MSDPAISPPHLLARNEPFVLDLESLNADNLKQAVRFWFDKVTAYKSRKAECARLLTQVFQDPRRLKAGLQKLTDEEREVLAVCKHYGGAIPGPVLACELLTRNLVTPPQRQASYYERQRNPDVVGRLCGYLLLLSRYGLSRWDDYYSSWDHRLHYPDLSIHPAVRDLLVPAPVPPWAPTVASAAPATSYRRSAAEVALDLWTVAQGLESMDGWKTNRGGTPAKSVQNRLRKLLPAFDDDPMAPPAVESLYHEILRGLGAIKVQNNLGTLDRAAVERCLGSPAVVQGWHWVHAWLGAPLWQDGIGVVSDRDSYDSSARIDPGKLQTARELLVWALGRVAHGGDDWLDLETFLPELWSATRHTAFDFYWSDYCWNPTFAPSLRKVDRDEEGLRKRSYWLENEGRWAANALLGTLVYLGLVERGSSGSGPENRLCFRLTAVGRAIFRFPELAPAGPAREALFLTIQPNHEVLVYLDAADAGAVGPLARMAERASAPGGLVQTFRLTRESVYQALESGLGLAEIRRFLQEHSKTGLPANVAVSLAEWGRKREALVVRTDVVLAARPQEQGNPPPLPARARAVGGPFFLLPRRAGPGGLGLRRDHTAEPHPCWHVDDQGHVRVDAAADSIALARLGQFAEPADGGWHITAATVRRARERGIPAEQVLEWLNDHLADPLPSVVETMIRNWAGGATVFCGPLWMLQVPQPQACGAILDSRRFRPLLLGHVPPDWFIVRPEKEPELRRLLEELGFAVGDTFTTAGGPVQSALQEERSTTARRQRRRSRE